MTDDTTRRPLARPRRNLLRALSVLAAIMAPVAGAPVTGALAAETRPNILFLFADDWGRYASCYAPLDGPGGINDVVRTPHVDAIAKQGVLFRNAHVSAPSCTPCRSALLTGQHFWRTGTGAILLGAVWDPSLPSFPPLLEQAGYHVGYAHKVWGPGTPANAPFRREQAYQKRGGRVNQFSQNVTQLVAGGADLEAAKAEILAEVRGNFHDFLAARPDAAPFCFWFGPTNVHRQWTKGSGKALWGIDPDDLEGRLPPHLPDVPEVREDVADYLGEIAAWDAAVGTMLAELEASGLRDNTLVVLSGDHGPPGFPHGKCNLYGFGTGVCLAIAGPGVRGGRVVDDFTSLTDLAPTFLETAGLPVPEGMTGRSLRPVLAAETGGLVDATRTQVFTGRERHVASARADFKPYPQRAIRTATHALIVNFRPDRWPLGDPRRLHGGSEPTVAELENDTFVTLPDEDAGPTKAWLVGARDTEAWRRHFEWVYGRRPRLELYDLVKDPHETTNVAADPAYAEVCAALEDRLMDELVRTGDPRLIDDGRFFETPPMAAPVPRPARRDRPAAGDRKPGAAATRRVPGPAAGARPNVLFLFADDMTFEAIRALGGLDIDTPHLDRLVARGTTFTHASNMGSWSGAVCVASRTMLITGRSVWDARRIYEATDRERQAGVLWPQLMKRAGYRTAFTGKWHIRADASRCFDEARHVRPGMPKDTPSAYARPPVTGPDPWSPFDTTLGGYWEGGRHWSEVTADDAIDFLAAAGTHIDPFFCYVAFNAPHDPRQAPQAWVDRYPLERIALPRPFLPEYPHAAAIGCGPGLRDEKLAPFPRTEHAVRVHRREYFALVSHLDAQIGRVLAALEASGRAAETWIFFTADHGLAVGHHGLLGKQNMYDHSLRVPFVVSGPGVAAGRRIDAPIYLQDVMPTTLELAGVERPDHVFFTSLLPLLDGRGGDPPYDAIYGAYLGLQRAVIHDGWKLMAYPQAGVLRLYHVAEDPHEERNLADDPRHAGRVESLLARLVALQESLGDDLDLAALRPATATR
jgi:N-sulfoglucosamine sulfohydrolase